MDLKKIIYYPDMRLLAPSNPISSIDGDLKKLIDEMMKIMYAANGVGLAAPQIGINKQLAVVDVSEKKNQPICIINPSIVESKELVNMDEGCLSVPGTFASVRRFRYVKVEALNEHGEPVVLEGEDLFAQCLQHEIDHLNGKLYIDHLSKLKRSRVLASMKKYQRQHSGVS